MGPLFAVYVHSIFSSVRDFKLLLLHICYIHLIWLDPAVNFVFQQIWLSCFRNSLFLQIHTTQNLSYSKLQRIIIYLLLL